MKKITMFLLMMSISNLYAQNQMQIVNLSMVDAYSQIPLDRGRDQYPESGGREVS